MMSNENGRGGLRSGSATAPLAALLVVAIAGAGWAPPCALAAQSEEHRLTYTGAESELIAPGAELFSQVENGMPGDTFAGSLTVENESRTPCEFFVATRDVAAIGPQDALERIAYTIVEAEDAVIFDGALAEADDGGPISLGVLEPGDSARVDYAVVIPPELTNEYAGTEVGLNVAVSAVDRSVDANGPMAADEGSGASLGKTGDARLWFPLALAGIGAATVGGCAVMVRRSRSLR